MEISCVRVVHVARRARLGAGRRGRDDTARVVDHDEDGAHVGARGLELGLELDLVAESGFDMPRDEPQLIIVRAARRRGERLQREEPERDDRELREPDEIDP
jgi:hypothetical protein